MNTHVGDNIHIHYPNLPTTHENWSSVLPYPYNNHFQFREILWSKLVQHFSQNQVNPYVILTGLGGNGKTTLAVHWAHKQKEAKPDLIVRWMVMDNTSMDASLKNLAKDLGINSDEKNLEDLSKEIAKKINQSPWLIVWDNVDNYDAIKEILNYFSPSSKQQHLLITTRDSVSWGGSDCIDVDVYTLEESLKYMQLQMREAKHPGWDKNQAKILAEHLGYHPLALELAMGQICLYKFSLSKYLEKLKIEGISTLDEKKAHSLAYQANINKHTIATLWKIGLEKLPKEAVETLRFMSFTHNENIRRELLINFLDEKSYTKARLALNGQSLISEFDDNSIKIHNLLQEVIRKETSNLFSSNEKFKLKFSQDALTAIEKTYFSEFAPNNMRKLREGLTHLATWKENSWSICSVEQKTHILYLLGKNEIILANYTLANKYLDEALSLQRRQKPNEQKNSAIAAILHELGKLFYAKGNYIKALEFYDQSLQIKYIIYNKKENHSAIADTLHQIGMAYYAKKEYLLAQENYEKALAMRQIIYEKDINHPAIADTLNELGYLYRAIEKDDLALKNYNNALEKYYAFFEKETPHSRIAATLQGIGNVYYDKKEYPKARYYYEKSLQMKYAVFGQEYQHPRIATSLSGLGDVCHAEGSNHEAINYYNQALKIYEEIYGENANYPSIANTLYNLAISLKELKNNQASRQYYQKALGMYKVLSKEKYADKIQSIEKALLELSSSENLKANYDSSFSSKLLIGIGLFGASILASTGIVVRNMLKNK